MARRRSRPAAKAHAGWTEAHVQRLFWRAGFGATPDEAATWARRGKTATLDHLVEVTGRPRYVGPAPTVGGYPLDPLNVFGHDQLWFVDRMVRSTQPLREKMTLFWHDHFATRGEPTPLTLRQNAVQRRRALGSFPDLLRAMTVDPALPRALSLHKSVAKHPNENYGRELMELFTLGSGYTEFDVREASRALAGLREVKRGGLAVKMVLDESKRDTGLKTIFGKTADWRWDQVLDLCVLHPAHGPFLAAKLWDFFVGTPLDPLLRDDLARLYVRRGLQLKPLVRRILADPQLYANLDKPDLVKWPAVLVAGQLRALGAPASRTHYADLMASMGQQLFQPPSVAGWDWGVRWLGSNAMRARFELASSLTGPHGPARVRRTVPRALTPAQHIALAVEATGSPVITRPTERALRRLVARYGRHPSHHAAADLQATMRHLLISGPDNQLC